jgi:hypothetical protein
MPQQHVADDRRLLHAQESGFGAFNEVDLEDDIRGLALQLATAPPCGVG